MTGIDGVKNWLPQHRLLGILALLGGIAAVGAYIYLVRPLRLRVEAMEQFVASEAGRLRQQGWPTQEEKLLKQQADKSRELDQLGQRGEQIWRRVGKTFANQLAEYDEDEQLFIGQVTRLDYEDAFDTVCSRLNGLEGAPLAIHPVVLQLNSDTVSPYVYQLLLQLWTLDEVMALALQHGLVPIREPTEVPIAGQDGKPVLDDKTGKPRMRIQPVSQVTLPDVRPYLVAADDDRPYLIEIPVRFKARCTPRELHAFLDQIADASQPRLIVVNRLEIHRLPPGRQFGNEALDVQVECAAFLRLRQDLRLSERPKPKPLPRGA